MKPLRNPFITSGYESAEYFCDREQESENLIREVTNGNNLALISTRRMGKTGLIQHCFNNPEIKGNYYTFFVDIYATKSLRDLVFSLSRLIVDGLKPFGKKAIESFWNSVKSLQGGITFDPAGNPSFNLQLGDIRSTEATLDEIFRYLEKASRPVIVAIDEFQQVAYYTEKNVEALLRTHIQHCRNARFIFAGSQRHVMGNMFANASRPFYQSVSMMYLECIGLSEYENFARRHFENSGRKIEQGVVADITPERGECRAEMIPEALGNILDSYKYTYQEILFRLPERQKELLIAISKEGAARAVTSGEFVQKYSLPSPSSVQAALKGLLEKDFVTHEQGVYRIYDKFFGIWLNKNY